MHGVAAIIHGSVDLTHPCRHRRPELAASVRPTDLTLRGQGQRAEVGAARWPEVGSSAAGPKPGRGSFVELGHPPPPC